MSNSNLRHACRCLRAGGIVAYPTEAVYGLGCDPNHAAAVEKLRKLKGRQHSKGFILLASQQSFLTPFLDIDQQAYSTLQNTWPGPITWVIPSHPSVPASLTGKTGHIAARVSNHPLATQLSDTFRGAIVSTSANPSKRPPARTALMVRRYFGHQIDYILGGPTGALSRPTEIRELLSGKILRSG